MTVDLFSANLGDALWVTPLAVRNPDLVVRMRKGDKRCEATAPIFDGLCKVELVDDPKEPLKSVGEEHVTQRILKAYGYSGPSIPFVALSYSELRWAHHFLKKYPKPIVFINGNSANKMEGNARAKYVRPPVEALTELVKHYRAEGWDVLQFGPSPLFYDKDTFDPLEGAVHIRGLTVRQLAACYALIGLMISGDTGDYHLMLATGGQCFTLVPEHNDALGYRHWDLLYDKACWGDERPRVTYIHHSQWECLKSLTNVNK